MSHHRVAGRKGLCVCVCVGRRGNHSRASVTVRGRSGSPLGACVCIDGGDRDRFFVCVTHSFRRVYASRVCVCMCARYNKVSPALNTADIVPPGTRFGRNRRLTYYKNNC